MIYDNEFTCPSGHTFNANAKIRARCPECGKMARRFTSKSTTKVVDDTKPSDTDEKPVVDTKPVEDKPRKLEVVRVGKPRIMAAKPTVAKKKKVTLAKDARGRFLPKAKSVAKKVVKKPSLVKTVKVNAKNVTPKVKRPPSRTAIARHIAAPKSYIDEMIERYG